MTQLASELFRPLRIGGKTLRNRLVFRPFETGMENDPRQREALLRFYEARAADRGAGMVVVAGGVPHFTGKRESSDEVMTEKTAPGWKVLTEGLRKSDTRTLLQLRHWGAASNHPFALSSSAFRNPETQRTARRAPAFLIASILRSYARAARAAVQMGGFDGIELYGGTLSLPNVFFSGHFNKRRDAWGLKNRMRFAVDAVRLVKRALGPSPILSYRLSLTDISPEGARWHEIIMLANALTAAGVNHLSFDVGLLHSLIPVESSMTPPGTWTPFMETLAREVHVPVSFGMKLGTLDDMAQVLSRHPGSLIELDRPLVADPSWGRKLAEESEESIVPCIDCPQGCRLSCPMNFGLLCPELDTLRVDPQKKSGSVLVVGGGVAGMTAAWTKARQGCRVTLLESEAELGGGALLASRIAGCEGLGRLVGRMASLLGRVGVEVRLSTKADAQWILNWFISHRPHGRIVLATGFQTRLPDIPGAESLYVLTWEDLLRAKAPVGRRIALLGDNTVSRLLARHLTTAPSEKRTAGNWLKAWGIGDPSVYPGAVRGFIPFLEKPLRTVYCFGSFPHRIRKSGLPCERQWLLMHGIQMLPEADIESIDANLLRVRVSSGSRSGEVFRVDHIVAALQFEPSRTLAEALRAKKIPFLEVGAEVSSPSSLEDPSVARDMREAALASLE